MIKKALEYIIGLGEAKVQEINGQMYADKHLDRVSFNPKADAVRMHTLTSLVDYIKANIDTMGEKMILHVVSPTNVRLYSSLDAEREREYMVDAVANLPSIDFDRFVDHESFCIGLQSKFVQDPETDVALVLKFAGTVEDGTVAQYGDDGMTQKATIKTGIASKADAKVPNPVKLRPYRTFHEVEQPASDFIFRMKSERGISCALFEADGGAWENAAMANIKTYLEFELADVEGFTVIS